MTNADKYLRKNIKNTEIIEMSRELAEYLVINCEVENLYAIDISKFFLGVEW